MHPDPDRNSSKLILFRLSGLFLLMSLSLYTIAKPEFSLTTSTTVASEGYLTLSWGPPGAQPPASPAEITLSVFDAANLQDPIRSLKLHDQQQVHLSGFENGDYQAILTSGSGLPISNPVTFSVRHHSLHTAFSLFSLGLILFIGLILCVFFFTRREDTGP